MLKAAFQTGGPLNALAQRSQFILYTADKMPVNPNTLEVANAHDPSIWVSSDTAVYLSSTLKGYGVGFVFTADDPFYFLDIDKCLEPDGVTWSPVAMELLASLPGAAVEVSLSGRGLHVFGRTAQIPHGNKNVALGIELYTEGRYVALTGTNAMGDANVDSTPHLAPVIDKYFSGGQPGAAPARWTDSPAEGCAGPTDDNELVRKARSSRSADSVSGSDEISSQNNSPINLIKDPPLIWKAVPLFFLAGFAATFFGIGGGVINTPTLYGVFNLPIHYATAGSTSIIFFTAIFNTITYGIQQKINWVIGITMGLGMMVGGRIGAKFASRISRWLTLMIITVLLVITGIRIIIGIL